MTIPLLQRLESLFEQHRDPVRAVSMARYMRNQFPYYGIPGPLQERLSRDASQGAAEPSEDDVACLARACWERDEREWQYFACGYLRRHVAGCSPTLLDTIEHLVTTKSWWDTVDTLASHTVGTLATKHPAIGVAMDVWIESENLWLARTAILHQLRFKSATDAERLFAYCSARAGDQEFFIRKAIGWALREYSKTAPDAVRDFVERERSRLSGLSVREALRVIERRKR